eukprot:TRINITY_DN9080_c0_g1_i1.p3 TRINITY_DN9080_c0_g1~~TRINITY_DN9080_c0_g1_i1.p3  ORF type:complete len:76 (-),score=16.58 TRINITY_DN9080_c0_g1_i1:157-384(-)
MVRSQSVANQPRSIRGYHGIPDIRFNITDTCKLVICERNIATFCPPPVAAGDRSAVVNAANDGLLPGGGVCGGNI